MFSQPVSSPKANILVIDDTPDNLNLLSAMLLEQGYKVRSVTKGSTGLRGAQAVPPDLILLDIHMPQMNGYEVCQRLKADERTRAIPVIFISALEDVPDKVKAFAVGGVDYVTKPFQIEEVLARIETHLTLCRLQQQLQVQNAQLQQEISEREQALIQQQQAEERFTKAFLASPSPIAIATLIEGQCLEVNPSFLRMSGYQLEEVIGQTLTTLNLGLAAADYTQAVQQLLSSGSLHNQECELRTKAGEIRTVLLSMERIEIAGVPCTLNIVNDITEHKRLENEFISLVSHELRTPLTSLMGALDLLGACQLGNLTEQGQKVLQIATTNTERLIRLVNDILDLERMKSGTIPMQKTQCSVADLLIQSGELMQAMADQAQVQLVIEPVALNLWADADRLLQTLTNLLSNAIKFSEPGATVWMRAETLDRELRLSVQDQGRGIPVDQLQTIFERFQQVDASDSRQKGGTGLGLAICRNIVEQHQGKIWVDSQLGQGSTFYLSLPLEATV